MDDYSIWLMFAWLAVGFALLAMFVVDNLTNGKRYVSGKQFIRFMDRNEKKILKELQCCIFKPDVVLVDKHYIWGDKTDIGGVPIIYCKFFSKSKYAFVWWDSQNTEYCDKIGELRNKENRR